MAKSPGFCAFFALLERLSVAFVMATRHIKLQAPGTKKAPVGAVPSTWVQSSKSISTDLNRRLASKASRPRSLPMPERLKPPVGRILSLLLP